METKTDLVQLQDGDGDKLNSIGRRRRINIYHIIPKGRVPELSSFKAILGHAPTREDEDKLHVNSNTKTKTNSIQRQRQTQFQFEDGDEDKLNSLFVSAASVLGICVVVSFCCRPPCSHFGPTSLTFANLQSFALFYGL